MTVTEHKPECKRSDCKVSTGIHDGLTFGRGKLDNNGYWQFPCNTCAREWEKNYPDDAPCWPFTNKYESEHKCF